MIEMFESPKQSFYSLVAEARDCLHAINRLGGPEGTYYKLSRLLKEQTPRFDWNEEDTRRFILGGRCRFHEYLTQLRGRKQNERDLLTLEDVVRIRAAASEKLEPMLAAVRLAGAIPPIPPDLVVSNCGQELTYIFFHSAATELAYDRVLNDHLLREIQRVAEGYLASKRAREADDAAGGPPGGDPSPA